MIPASDELIDQVRRRAGVSTRKLATALGVEGDEHDDLVESLLALQADGRLVRVPGQGWFLPDQTDHRVGILHFARRGHAFINPVRPDPLGDIYVPVGATGSAFDGDMVLATVAGARGRGRTRGGSGRQKLREGRVVDVVRRRCQLVRGIYRRGKSPSKKARPPGLVKSMESSGTDIYVPSGKAGGAKDGQKVLVKLLDGHAVGDRPRGEVVHVIDDDGSLEVDFLAIAAEFGLPVEHSDEAIAASKRLRSTIDRRALAGREDLRDLVTLTIDPDDARDFDDAVSLEPLGGGGFRLGVHIADVAHFVRPGTVLDSVARERGTSIYLPGRVVPMLPERIANDLASLRPDEDRLAKTAMIDFDRDGAVRGVRVFRSVIRSKRRFTYDEVLAILAEMGGAGDAASLDRDLPPLPDDHERWADLLMKMAGLRDLLHRRRRERGSLFVDLPRLRLDVVLQTGEVRGIDRERADPSHQLIEEFMLAANEAVAGHLEKHDLPGISRVHDAPEEDALEEFFDLLDKIGDGVDPRRRKLTDIQATLESVRDAPYAPIINLALLRCLPHAEYRAERSLHFALATSQYCHFTSPIRRYPDLVVHQILDEFWDDRMRGKRKQEWLARLPAIASESSRLERRAEEAEREMIRLRLIRHLADRVGEIMDAMITSVHPFGFFVREEKHLIDGLVHISTLSDDYYEYDQVSRRLRGARRGREFRLGERIRVRLAELDPDMREIRFELEERSGEGSGTERAKKRGRSRRSVH